MSCLFFLLYKRWSQKTMVMNNTPKKKKEKKISFVLFPLRTHLSKLLPELYVFEQIHLYLSNNWKKRDVESNCYNKVQFQWAAWTKLFLKHQHKEQTSTCNFLCLGVCVFNASRCSLFQLFQMQLWSTADQMKMCCKWSHFDICCKQT